MLKKKIMDWLYEKYEDDYIVDYEAIAEVMIELAEDMDEEDLNFKELYDEAIEQLDDDGGIYPNERDYDAEDEDYK